MPQIALAQIKLDQRAQPRQKLDTEVTAEYAEAMKAGAAFPPLTVFHDGKVYWLADGFHRHYAAVSAGLREFSCTVKNGSLRDAILHSCQANTSHGLRRSDEDKRRAVSALLQDEEWGRWADRQIARQCAVSHPFVARVREEVRFLTGNVSSEDRSYRTKHGTVASMQTAKIGQARKTVSTGEQSTAAGPADQTNDAPPAHAALIVMARGIADMRASVTDVVTGCPDDAKEDLREACEDAASRLADVVNSLQTQLQQAA